MLKMLMYRLTLFRPRTTVSRPVMPIGSSDFDEVIDDGLKVIDKTKFIQDFVESDSKVCRILRPRRFGKSLNLNMLKSFLSLGAQAEDFRRFDIGKNQAFLEKHCGQYPVVYLDLKDCKGGS